MRESGRKGVSAIWSELSLRPCLLDSKPQHGAADFFECAQRQVGCCGKATRSERAEALNAKGLQGPLGACFLQGQGEPCGGKARRFDGVEPRFSARLVLLWTAQETRSLARIVVRPAAMVVLISLGEPVEKGHPPVVNRPPPRVEWPVRGCKAGPSARFVRGTLGCFVTR